MVNEKRIFCGLTERGEDIALDLWQPWHVGIQGASRSGKSVFVYGLISQLVGRHDVIVAGIDPTGILLNPVKNEPGEQFRHLSMKEPDQAVQVLRRLTDEMDARIESLLELKVDVLKSPSESWPKIIVFLEEWPGALAAMADDDVAENRKAADRLEPKARRYARRLIQEGAKVGFMVVMMAQRMDASIVGGAERSNIALRISMRVDNADAVRMLHPGIASAPDLVERMRTFLPGVGLIETPQGEQKLFRAPYLTYSQYVEIAENRHALRCA